MLAGKLNYSPDQPPGRDAALHGWIRRQRQARRLRNVGQESAALDGVARLEKRPRRPTPADRPRTCWHSLLVSGIAQGALYALVALAMTVVYRATTVINFGQGDFVMAGAFVVYVLVVLAGAPFVAVGACSRWYCCSPSAGRSIAGLIRPIVAGPHLALAMMAVAVGYALRGVARVVWGREVLPFPKVLPQGSFTVGRRDPVGQRSRRDRRRHRDGRRTGTGVLCDAARQDGAGCFPVRARGGTCRHQCGRLPGHDVGGRAPPWARSAAS